MYHLLFAVFATLLCAVAPSHAAETTPLPAPTTRDESVTAMTMGRQGELIIATADGRIWALRRGGERLVLADGLPDISCLALSPRGSIYAGSAAHGTVTRLDRQGQAATIADGLSGLQGLTTDRDETIFVLRGPQGCVERLGNPADNSLECGTGFMQMD